MLETPADPLSSQVPTSSAAQTTTRIVAMDVDNTLVDGQTQTYLVKALFKAKILKGSMYVRVLWWHMLYTYFNIWPTHLQKIVTAELRGLPMADGMAIARDVIAKKIMPRLHPEAVAALRQWQDSGAKVFLVSAAVAPLISALATAVKADGAIATRLKDSDEIISGIIDGPMVVGEEKWTRLQAYCDANFTAWQLEAAYGDDDTDVPLLARAQTAFAINPKPYLKATAKKRGWTILSWGAQR